MIEAIKENKMKNRINVKQLPNRVISPLVTVVITVYNNPLNELEECIKSVVNQSYSPIEIILVDDGSNSKYKSRLKITLLKYPKIKYLRKSNGGLPSARNFGILNSSADFICFIDPDDTYHKDKILIQTKILIENDNVFAVAGGSITNSSINGLQKSEKKIPILISGYYFPYILNSFLGIHGTPNYLFRNSSIVSVGLFDERLKINEDRDLLYRLSKDYELITHQDLVCTVNKTKNSSSNNLNRIKLESKLIFLKKIVDDGDIFDLNIKANYTYKYSILKLILSSNYMEYRKNYKNFNVKIITNSGLKLAYRTMILSLLSYSTGFIIYKIYRQKNKDLITKIALT